MLLLGARGLELLPHLKLIALQKMVDSQTKQSKTKDQGFCVEGERG